MAKVSPLAHWSQAGADCYDTDYLTSTAFPMATAHRLNPELRLLFLRTLARTPQLVTEVSLCRAHPAWALFPGADPISVGRIGWSSDLYGFAIFHPDIYHNRFYPVMRPQPIYQPLRTAALFYYNLLVVPQLQWLIWNGAAWCWILYALVIRLSWRLRRREMLALAAATAGFQLTVLAGIPAPLYRYMAPPTLIGVMALPLLFSRLREARPTPTEG